MEGFIAGLCLAYDRKRRCRIFFDGQDSAAREARDERPSNLGVHPYVAADVAPEVHRDRELALVAAGLAQFDDIPDDARVTGRGGGEDQ